MGCSGVEPATSLTRLVPHLRISDAPCCTPAVIADKLGRKLNPSSERLKTELRSLRQEQSARAFMSGYSELFCDCSHMQRLKTWTRCRDQLHSIFLAAVTLFAHPSVASRRHMLLRCCFLRCEVTVESIARVHR